MLNSCELKTITNYLSGQCLYVSEKTRNKPLEDDTVYSRYGIFAVTSKTLEDILLNKAYPLVRATPGGYYVELNGEAIKGRRQKLGVSIGKICEMTGLSRRTLYAYERNSGKASVSTAYKLEWIMGVPLVQPIDIFRSAPEDRGFLSTAKRFIKTHLGMQPVIRKLRQFNFSVMHTKRAPFDFVAKAPEEKINILGGIVHEKEKAIDRRAEEILSLSKVVNAQPVLIAEGEVRLNQDVPIISNEEIRKIEEPNEFIKRL